MKDLDELYLEHEQKITDNLDFVKHVDLWSEQISFLMEEQPFRAPAVFLAYRALGMQDIGDKTQNIRMGVDIYYYYETFAATHRKSKKQEKGLSFLKGLSEIHKVFHASNGNYYSNMKRIGFAPIETGTANLLYVQKFECTVIDDSAKSVLETTEVKNIIIVNEAKPTINNDEDIYPKIEINKKTS